MRAPIAAYRRRTRRILNKRALGHSRTRGLRFQELEDRLALASYTPHGQELAMTDTVYGPNEPVEILFAKIAFLTQLDVHQPGDVGDFLSPAADIYIMPSG